MRILLDTNIVLRLGDRDHLMHGEALAAIDWLEEAVYDIAKMTRLAAWW